MSNHISQDFGDYEYDCLSHAGNQRRDRNVSLDAIEHVIENGEPKDSGNGRVNFEGRWNGAMVTVVTNPTTGDIITTYYGTNTTGDSLKDQIERQNKRQQKIQQREGAAYTGAWS